MKADGQKGRSRVGRRALNKFLRKFVPFSRVDSFSALERSYEISKHLKQEPYKHKAVLITYSTTTFFCCTEHNTEKKKDVKAS